MSPEPTNDVKLWELERRTRAIAASLDGERVLSQVVEDAVRLVEGDAAAVVLEQGDGVARVAAAVGVDADRVAGFHASLDERLDGRLRSLLAPAAEARVVSVPLVSHPSIRGVLAVRCSAAVPDEERLLAALADHAAVALANARRVSRLERDVQRAAYAERLLLEAASLLGSSLDYETTLANLARLASASLADRCVIDLVGPDGAVRRVAASAADPAMAELASQLFRFPPSLDGDHPVSRVLRTGRSEVGAEMSDAWVAAVARGPEHLALLRKLGLRSYMCVPLVARGRTLGTLWLASAKPGHAYTETDLSLAEEVAQRAALAVDNARLYGEARDAVRARDAFLARASHELRTPLTSALGTVRLLRRALDGTLEQRPDELVDIAARSLEAMAVLVNDLLDVSKLAAGGDDPKFARVDVTAVVARARSIVEPQAAEKAVGVTASIPDGLALEADPQKLEQVLVNLLGNAVKFTGRGGRVIVEAEATGDHVTLRVRDTGEGIDPGYLEAIFQPFFRGSHQRARRPRGTGLGLAICRQIVAAHGGRIWAESEGPGFGSTFVVLLPASSPARRVA